MAMYRESANSEKRLDWGTELAIGVRQFDETKGLEPSILESNASLRTAHEARRAARQPLLEARVELRLAGYAFDQAVRSFVRQAIVADGGKAGPITKAVAPQGITPIIAPRGRRQIPVAQKFVSDVAASKAAGVRELRIAAFAPVEAAFERLVAAGAAYEAAQSAYLSAFTVELAERAAHRTHMKHCVAMIRAAFPDDRERQRVVLPDADEPRVRSDDDDADDGGGESEA